MSFKRVFEFIIVFLIVVFVYQFIVIYFENGHEVSYRVASNDLEFNISEKYSKSDDIDKYIINITNNDKYNFVYYLNNSFNKQKRIIDRIESYAKDDYLCILPITINDTLDLEILCSDGNDLYSYEYINKKIDVSGFVTQLKLDDKFIDNKNEEKEEDGLQIYNNNFYDNEYLEVYRYKYLAIFNKGEYKTYQFSTNDIYKNNLGVFLNDYFLMPIVNKKNKVEYYYVANVKNGVDRYLYFDDAISPNIYNIGIVNNKLYIFDLNEKNEYELDPKEKKYRIIGNISNGFQLYENGEWVKKSVTEFTNDKVTIDSRIKDEELKFNYDHLYEDDDTYYLVDNNKLYKVYKFNKDLRILLTDLNNYNNLNFSRGKIYYLRDGYIYRYDQYGTKTLAYNNEFKYNNTNIYYVYNE